MVILSLFLLRTFPSWAIIHRQECDFIRMITLKSHVYVWWRTFKIFSPNFFLIFSLFPLKNSLYRDVLQGQLLFLRAALNWNLATLQAASNRHFKIMVELFSREIISLSFFLRFKFENLFLCVDPKTSLHLTRRQLKKNIWTLKKKNIMDLNF